MADPRLRVLYALRRSDLALQALKDERLRPLGLRAAHYSILAAARYAPGASSAEIARLVGVTAQTANTLVARLEERGLLERQAHPRHRHVVEIHLTTKGKRAAGRADALIDELEQEVTADMTAAEREQLRELLRRVHERIRAMQAQPHANGAAPRSPGPRPT